MVLHICLECQRHRFQVSWLFGLVLTLTFTRVEALHTPTLCLGLHAHPPQVWVEWGGVEWSGVEWSGWRSQHTAFSWSSIRLGPSSQTSPLHRDKLPAARRRGFSCCNFGQTLALSHLSEQCETPVLCVRKDGNSPESPPVPWRVRLGKLRSALALK